jgi:hypothetical protein
MAISDTFSLLKAGAETLRPADKIPEYNALLDAMARIRELEGDLSLAQKELRDAQQQVEIMLDNSEKIQACKRNGEYLTDEEGHSYCIGCAINQRRLSPVVWAVIGSKGERASQCTRCKQTFHRMVR